MIQVPDITDVDIAFGNVDHLPAEAAIAERFWQDSDPYHKITSKWFFEGLKGAHELGTPRDGVDATKAVRAIKAILASWAPKHQHKEAGVAMLIHEWFILPGESA